MLRRSGLRRQREYGTIVVMIEQHDCATTNRPSTPSSDAWKLHVGLGLAVPILGLLLTVDASGAVAPTFLPDHSLPTVCLFRRCFGLDCLTCGVTRSIVLLLHGHLTESIAAHRFGWLVLLVILAQVPYGTQLRWRGADAWRPSERTGVLFATAIFGALFVNRMCG